MPRTLDEIRREGLDALRERLGRAGMIRFLQQFDAGRGDYARDRHEWVDQASLADLAKSVSKRQSTKPHPHRRRKS